VTDTADLAARVLEGDRRAVARLVTLVENESPGATQALSHLFPQTGRAHIVGITGAPGCGKSTLVNELAKEIRRGGPTVGIVAVDPSSPFSGGALLGDRIRMRDLSGDEGIFIRSMASRGSLGGLARATGDVVKVLDAAGFEIILVETVGAGQSEVDIASSAHTTLVVQAPGMGDDIQAIKAGIMEIADIFVVNKADLPGAEATVNLLQMMQRLGRDGSRADRGHHGALARASDAGPAETDWVVPIVQTVATTGMGISELLVAMHDHRDHLYHSGLYRAREEARVAREFELLLREGLLRDLLRRMPPGRMESVLNQVAARQIDPYQAAQQLIEDRCREVLS
jgi:LAO/AO transport system kinase